MAVYIGSTKVGTTILKTSSLAIPFEVSEEGVLEKQTTPFTWTSQGINLGNALRYAFYECTGLTALDLSSVTTININSSLYSAFYNCTNLVSVNFNNLSSITATMPFGDVFNSNATSAFYNCGLTEMSFPSLTNLTGQNALSYAFKNCTSLATVYFSALTSTSFGSQQTQFNGMLSGVTGCTVHFPSNLQSVIGSWTSVTSGFGGTNTTVLFDLPATT